MARKTIRIGSRKSRLAIIQAEIVKNQILRSHPDFEIEIVTMDTTGDLILDKPLDLIGGKGLFTYELEQALRSGTIDISVHSLKDMPENLPPDLPILAYSKREDPRDALVLPKGVDYKGLDEINTEKPVGCSSARRTIQLLRLCNFISVAPVRGNVPTRIQKLDNGNFSALILAAAGLNRLGLQSRISKIFTEKEMLPAAGQGILAVQGRKDFDPQILQSVNDEDSRVAAQAERAVIAGLHCGCSSPAAAFCKVNQNEIELNALYVDESTGHQATGSVNGDRKDYRNLADKLANHLLKAVNDHE